jgi:hypothetical protein
MDDPVNVHGTSVRIMKKISDTKLLCRFMHEQSIGFTWAREGETVGFVENEAMNTIGEGKVESFQANSPEEFEISFMKPVPANIREGDALENLSCTPDVLIRNSFFGSNRARGILISTPGKVVIENNVFESSGSAILIPGDANGWYESGAVKDVTIATIFLMTPALLPCTSFAMVLSASLLKYQSPMYPNLSTVTFTLSTIHFILLIILYCMQSQRKVYILITIRSFVQHAFSLFITGSTCSLLNIVKELKY